MSEPTSTAPGEQQDQRDGGECPTLQELRREARELFERIERHFADLGKGMT